MSVSDIGEKEAENCDPWKSEFKKNEPYHWALETLSKPQHKEGKQGKAWRVLFNWGELRSECRVSGGLTLWGKVPEMRELSRERTPVISVHRDRTIDTNYTETLMGKKVNKNSVTCGKILKSQTYI